MVRVPRLSIAPLFFFFLVSSSSVLAQEPPRRYRLIDLGLNGGIPTAINESDTVISGLSRFDLRTGWQKAFAFQSSSLLRAYLTDINDNGDFVGGFISFFFSGGACGFSSAQSGILNGVSSPIFNSISSISNSGNLAGVCSRTCTGTEPSSPMIQSSCVLVDGNLIEVIAGAPDGSTNAQAINDGGVAVINSIETDQNQNQISQVSRFVPGQGLIPIESGTVHKVSGVAVNSSGTIVGHGKQDGNPTHPFLSPAGGAVVDIEAFNGAETEVAGLNDAGEFIGTANFSSGEKVPFLYTSSGQYNDLNSFLPSDSAYYLETASAINNASDIAGSFRVNADQTIHPFILTSRANPAISASFRPDRVSVPAIFRPKEGNWYLRSASGPVVVRWGLRGDVPVQGDFDRDGQEDLVIFRPSTGYWWTCFSSTNYNCALGSGVQYGLRGDLPLSGDFDGDGRSDRAVFRAFYAVGSRAATIRIEGQWYIQLSTGGEKTEQWGLRDDLPVPEDYDGDGKADIAVYRPSNGTWYILFSSKGYSKAPSDVGQYQFGLSADHPMPADYDGDGRADLTVWRPSSGEWFRASSAFNFAVHPPLFPTVFQGYSQVQFGLPGDTPVRGDFDGDQTYDHAVWREKYAGIIGTWYANSPARSGAVAIQWGLPGDLPIGLGVKRLRQLLPRNANR